MAAEAEDPAQWLQANQARLPNAFSERLSYVAGLTSNFEAAGWLDPAQIVSGGSRNEFPNTPPTQTALMCASSPLAPPAASACCGSRTRCCCLAATDGRDGAPGLTGMCAWILSSGATW